ncbi:MAG: CRISPR-associated endonuclease Cas1, partial [Bacteroidaceae bacterium]|nr:CRISPR-associated endonuclease Cas1 [Bacteroidaceae bacterium]
KEMADALLAELTTYLQEFLHLHLNPPQLIEIEKGFEFLGILFTKKGLSLTDKKFSTLRHNIQQITIKNGVFNAKSRNFWQGITNYYANVLPQDILFSIDKIAVEHFNALIVRLSKQDMPGRQALQNCFKGFDFLSEEMQDRKNVVVTDLYNRLLESRNTISDTEEDKSLNKKLIESRKREYRKRENEQSELLVATPGAYLGFSNHGVTVRKGTTILLKHSNPYLKHITIRGEGVSLSTNAISLGASKGVGIDIFNGTGKHEATILAPKFLEASLWKQQTLMEDGKRLELARRLIMGKLKNQENLIKYFYKYHKASGEVSKTRYEQTITAFDREIAQLKEETDTIKIMGDESQAAIAYWAFIREMLQDDNVAFAKREHKGATDLMNSMLNYGYAILYSRVWQALLAAKLNPYDSVIHVRQNGKPTFVFDCVELFRAQAVDRIVISLIQKKQKLEVEGGLLNETTRKKIAAAVLERMNRYEKYRGTEMTFTTIIKQQAKEISEYILSGKTFKPYIAKW